ncbi:MAG: inorganic phosphate transporter [Bacteroidia bacterium]|nr:inorganic phosphate transporter [Bacteroidia bacterium]
MSLLLVIIFLALVFDYINGFHDAANSIATIVSTKVLTPTQAVLWAAFFNFMAFFIFKDHGVANTIAKTVQENFITLPVIFSGLVAAIIWNLMTWGYGIPSSSSHTLIGGFAGAALTHAGFNFDAINAEPVIRTVSFIVLAPLIGMLVAYLISVWFIFSFRKSVWPSLLSSFLMVGVTIVLFLFMETNPAVIESHFESPFLQVLFYEKNFKWVLLAIILYTLGIFTLFLNRMNHARANEWFRKLQLVSSAAFSLGHGGNDAQKVMGIITVALIAAGDISSFEEMPVWVPLACYGAIAAGTMSGGWKIVKTMGTKITKVTPFEGVAAEAAGAVTLFLSENLKIPVSTTHTITGSIIGVGATKRLSAVRWGVTTQLFWAWVMTIPISALLAAGTFFLVSLFLG